MYGWPSIMIVVLFGQLVLKVSPDTHVTTLPVTVQVPLRVRSTDTKGTKLSVSIVSAYSISRSGLLSLKTVNPLAKEREPTSRKELIEPPMR